MRMLANVQQKTIKPIIDAVVKAGSRVHSDECDIYARLTEWGFTHETGCHAGGEYARDDDGDGFCEVHVNTMRGWSLLRSWLRPHRGISQEKLPSCFGSFEVVHSARKRGKALLDAPNRRFAGARRCAITPKPVMSHRRIIRAGRTTSRPCRESRQYSVDV